MSNLLSPNVIPLNIIIIQYYGGIIISYHYCTVILPQYFFNRTTSVESWACLHFKNTWSRNHISHHVFYVPESVCLGWRSFVGMWGKNVLDPSILKRVWSSEYDQPHNSHDHCHIVLEDNLISSQTIITSSCEREHSSSFTSDGSERAAEVLLLWQRESAAVLIGQRPTR